MNKKLIKSILMLFLLGVILAGCQEKVDTPAESTSSDSKPASSDPNSESTESTNHTHSHDHDHDDEKQKEIYSGVFEDSEVKEMNAH